MRIKRLICFILLLSVLLGQIRLPAAASEANDILRQLLQYYLHHQDSAETDILRLLAELETTDPAQAEDWREIISAWSSACNELVVHAGVLPDGLPEDDSLCIVVMGFALNYNGSMSEELLGRIKTALASAEKYPNAYILCTGGGTAGGNHAVTEAGQMAAWLQQQGIDASRIIIENKSYSTELNARYGLNILRESYPQIHSLALISSDYHIRRCHLLFNAEIFLTNTENQYQVVSNAAYEAGYIGESGYWSEAESLSNLLKLNLRQSAPPELSQLTEITVTGAETCFTGEMPEFSVTAHYDSGFSREVTAKAEIHHFDSTVAGDVQAEIIYGENGITKSVRFTVTVMPLPTEAPTEPAVTTQTEQVQQELSVPATEMDAPMRSNRWIFRLAGTVAVSALVILVIPKQNKRGKYQK